jgi:hypothetical protein
MKAFNHIPELIRLSIVMLQAGRALDSYVKK